MPSVLPGLKIQVVSGRIFCGTHIADDIAPLRFLPRSYQGVLFDSPVSARGRGIYSAGMVEAVLGEAKNAPAVSRGITKENQKIKTLAFPLMDFSFPPFLDLPFSNRTVGMAPNGILPLMRILIFPEDQILVDLNPQARLYR